MTINRLFTELPEYDPHPDLWNRIDADLASAEQFDQAIGNLPQMEPEADLWTSIEDELDGQVVSHPARQERKPVFWPFVRPLWAAATVAALLVLIGVWTNWEPVPDTNERVEYAVETGLNDTAGPVAIDAEADQRASDFIAQQCAMQTVACQQPAVYELRNQLAELTTEQQRLNQERQTFGDDPMLIRAQVKVENQRAEVTKELITLLRS